MLTQQPHPDEIKDWHDFKAIKRGGKQAADDAAMDAYWLALEEGKSKEEAGKIFSETYNTVLNAQAKK